MKKKIISLLLILSVFIVAIAGCGNDKDQAEDTADDANDIGEEDVADDPNDAAEEVVPGDKNGDGKVIIGYIAKNIVDPFHAPINNYAKETLDGMVADGVIDDWTGVLDGETDGNKQIDRADECIAQNCDYVIILPAEAAASDPAVTKLADAGVSVLVVNSATDSTDEVAMAYVGPDDVEAGRMLARWLVEQRPEGGKYGYCQGVIGNSAEIQRNDGSKEVMADYPEFEHLGDFPCEWQADKAANVATDLVSQHGDDLVGIICANDDMSSAAQRAVNDMDRSDVVCVGVDGNQNPLQMVKDGELGATVLQDGVGQLAGALSLIEKDMAGEEVESELYIPFVLVTIDNVDEYLE